jgi:DNA-binding response OmpR family regulator
LKLIDCIILTTSEAEEDMKRGYELGAKAVLTKPFGFESMVKLFESINSYWLKEIPIISLN